MLDYGGGTASVHTKHAWQNTHVRQTPVDIGIRPKLVRDQVRARVLVASKRSRLDHDRFQKKLGSASDWLND